MPLASASYLSSDRVGLALRLAPGLLGFGFRGDRDLGLLDLLAHDLLRGEPLQLGLGLRRLDLGLGIELRHLAALRRLRRLHVQLGVRLRDQRLRAVLAGDGLGFLRLDEDALLGLGLLLALHRRGFVLRHLDLLVAVRLGFTDRRQRFLLPARRCAGRLRPASCPSRIRPRSAPP